jgi:undecaprenyl-diphosphatase
MAIGLAQALALIPGTSRSGITISAGLFTGLTREAATRFSFLLSTPIIAAAAAFKVRAFISAPPTEGEMLSLVVGLVTSFVVGLAAIHFMITFLRTNTLLPFVIYRFGLAAVVVVVVVAGGRL